ncbi:DUF3788 domain-containing protein [Desulforamulus aquiferis]|uniref:DUF3788 domain-containing protein n=1 Tax=Desulforamulus aquiferis TaxID=1397668 RepID=A0AAW7ZDG0_9FIRM|nr:DUF3788 domain-containing protein [Desulforamulus aquiferis]MDO7787361.1 DUF3788 domain-containing protein [Desulforamulus aquiferis]
MTEIDLILDASFTPTYEDICCYMNKAVQEGWQEMNAFIQQSYKASPKLAYSKCSAKPGWNIKYKKAGKSICTLYPEKDGFIALVVISLDLVPLVEAMTNEFETEVLETVRTAKPFNGTKWLMIQVTNDSVLNNVKRLILLKNL